MLVLTRKRNEAIRIGDHIRILVTRIENQQVRLGIESPPDITILREEIYDAVRKGNRAAQHIDMDIVASMLKQQPQKDGE